MCEMSASQIKEDAKSQPMTVEARSQHIRAKDWLEVTQQSKELARSKPIRGTYQ